MKMSGSIGLDPEAWCLGAWMLKDCNGLVEVPEYSIMGWGIGKTSHMLKLQMLCGSLIKSIHRLPAS